MPNGDFYELSSVPICTIKILLDEVQEFEKVLYCGGMYFRGQNKYSNELRPTVGRDNFYKHGGKELPEIKIEQERNLLHRFKRYSYQYTNKILNDWEALFLARHHGLP